jgi:hypothetical protein
MTAPHQQQITAVVYEARRILKWHWRFKFVAANGQPLGHQYNTLHDASKAVSRIAAPSMPIKLEIHHRDGRIDELGPIL